MGNVAQQNLVVHRWVSPKACPGDYLYERHADIAKQVNALIKPEEDYLATMTEQQFNNILDTKLAAIAPVSYKYLEDIPNWGIASVKKCLDKKFIQGTGSESGKTVLNISADFLRTIVIMDRANLLN